MMKKLSPKQKGLLQLILDSPHEWVYFPGFDSLELEKYGLNLWDKLTITCAEKRGLIKTKKDGFFGKLTDLGKQALMAELR